MSNKIENLFGQILEELKAIKKDLRKIIIRLPAPKKEKKTQPGIRSLWR